MTHIFVPLDIETTGLNPKKDYILEIAWDVLDETLTPIFDEPRTFIVDHGPNWGDVFSALRGAPQVVRDMHRDSGLSAALLSEQSVTQSVIADRLKSDIRLALSARDANSQVHLLGRSVNFDRSFLMNSRAFNEEFGLFQETSYGSFHHSVVDLSSFRLIFESLGHTLPVIEEKTTHRALADVGEAAAMARALRNLIGAAL